MFNQFYVYIYLNPSKPGKFTYNNFISFTHEPFYVGKGSNGRLYDHLKNSKNKILYGTLKQINEQNLNPIIFKVNFNLLEEAAFELEKFLIKTIGRRNLKLGPLANMTDGGEGFSGYIFSKKHKRKIGEANKRRIISIKTRMRMRKAQKGKIPWNKGKSGEYTLSKEHKRKISAALTGQQTSKEVKEKMRINAAKNIPIIFRNENYLSISEASRKNNLSNYFIKKECLFK